MLKISLLGLFVEEQAFVKDLLTRELNDYEISWVPPKSDEVHLLIVNANFLDSHSLINFLRDLPKTTAIYSVGATKKGFDNSLKLSIPSLIFPIQKEDRLVAWIEGIKKSVQNRNIASGVSDKRETQQESTPLDQLLNQLFEAKIKMQAIAPDGTHYYLDAEKNRVFTTANQADHSELLFDDFTFEKGWTGSISDGSIEEIDLEAWLWNLCWYYPLEISYAANDQFTLKRWPTFLQSIAKDRALVISVTALLQSGPQTYEGLLHHPRANPEIVTHYLYLMQLFNYIEQSREPIVEKRSDKERGESKRGIRSFIGKLREAIGI